MQGSHRLRAFLSKWVQPWHSSTHALDLPAREPRGLDVCDDAAGCFGGGDDDSVMPPPEDEIFIAVEDRVDSNQDGFVDANDDVNPMDGMFDTRTRVSR